MGGWAAPLVPPQWITLAGDALWPGYELSLIHILLIVFLGMLVLFLVLGLTFSRGKGAFLISGYNTASKAEKARYDEKALCRFMGKIMFALAGCQGIMALGILVVGMWLLWVGIAAFLAVAFWTVIYANTGNRFRKN